MRLVVFASCLAIAACSRGSDAPDSGLEDTRTLVQIAHEARSAIATERFRVQLRADIGISYAKTGSIAEAKAELEEALNEASRMADRTDRDRLIARIAEGFEAAKEHTRALELAARLGTPDARSESLSVLARTAEEAAKIEQPMYRDAAFSRLTARAARRKDLPQAERLAAKIVDPGARAKAQVFIVRGYTRNKDDKRARRLTAELEGIAKSEAQAEIAQVLWKRGDRKGALRALDAVEAEYVRAAAMAALNMETRALELAANIRELALRSSAYEGVVRALMRNGAYSRALEILDRTPNIAAQLRLRSLIAIGLIRRGDLEAGSRVAEAIAGDPVWSPEALSVLAAARADRGDFSAALEAVAAIQNLEFRLPALAEVLVRHSEKAPPELKNKVVALLVEPR